MNIAQFLEASSEFENFKSEDISTLCRLLGSVLRYGRSEDIESYEAECTSRNVSGANFASVAHFVADALIALDGAEETFSQLHRYVDSDQSPSARHLIVEFEQTSESLADLVVYKKREQIKNEFNRATQFKTYTDIRPVFDVRKNLVEEYLYPVIIKVKTIAEEDFLFEVYEEDLDRIVDSLESAKRKLRVLRGESDD